MCFVEYICTEGSLSQGKNSTNTCPIERKIVRRSKLKPAVRFLNTLENLVISGKYAEYSCKFTRLLAERSKLDEHDLVCEFHSLRMVICGVENGCGLGITRQEIKVINALNFLRGNIRI